MTIAEFEDSGGFSYQSGQRSVQHDRLPAPCTADDIDSNNGMLSRPITVGEHLMQT